MADTLTLFDPLPPVLPPYATGSPTSKAAAIAIVKSGKRTSQKARVLEFITERGRYGATRNEIHRETGILIQSLCGRCDDLERESKIRKTVEVRDDCAVYVALVHL